MSLGNYMHTFRITLEVSIMSKSAEPGSVEWRMHDPGLYHGHDGVDMQPTEVTYLRTECTLPVRSEG